MSVIFHGCLKFIPPNLSPLRKWTPNIFERTHGKASVRIKQKKAAWNHDYLLKLLDF